MASSVKSIMKPDWRFEGGEQNNMKASGKWPFFAIESQNFK